MLLLVANGQPPDMGLSVFTQQAEAIVIPGEPIMQCDRRDRYV
ncbi:hypothetical protein SDC9_84278 [bioreactor metagenome]|uniref:Uncharacterized protein n=1 Tax=bioreactor metagenome TaxID=1076179 RepID=A0A644ZAD8_9ZZZZ